jgi:site-specific recombinase XerC
LSGFAGGFRRSELVALDVADLEETEAPTIWLVGAGSDPRRDWW